MTNCYSLKLPFGNFEPCLLQGKTSQLPVAVLAEEHLGQIRQPKNV